VTGHLIETAIVAAVAVVVSYTLSWVLTHRASDEYARHSIRRAVNFLVFLVALVAVGFVWHVYGGRAGLGIGFFAAGLAFALQEVIGAVAGWFNILLGGIYRIAPGSCTRGSPTRGSPSRRRAWTSPLLQVAIEPVENRLEPNDAMER